MFFQRLPVTSLEELLFTDTHTNLAVMSAIIELVKRLIKALKQFELYFSSWRFTFSTVSRGASIENVVLFSSFFITVAPQFRDTRCFLQQWY